MQRLGHDILFKKNSGNSFSHSLCSDGGHRQWILILTRCHTTEITTGKTLAAVLANSVVRPRTVKNSLPCYKRTMHGNDMAHSKDATKHTTTSEAR
jgi:hypothetical protein